MGPNFARTVLIAASIWPGSPTSVGTAERLAARRLDLLAHRVELSLGPPEQSDRGAGARHGQRYRPAEPAACARYDGDLTGQRLFHHSPPFSA